VIRLLGLLATSLLIPLAGSPATLPDLPQHLATLDSLHVHHQVDEAEELSIRLLTQARTRRDTLALQPLTAKLGRLYASYGRVLEGEPLLVESAELAEALRDTLALGDALRWLGYSLDQQGRLQEAHSLYVRMNSLARIAGDTKHQAWSLVGLAYLATLEGNYPSAEKDYRQAADLFAQLGQHQPRIWALNGLGAALQEAGQLDQALACYQEVVTVAQQVSYPAAEALAENNRGSLAFARGDPGSALESYRRAWALQVELEQKQDAIISGVNIADCLLELGRFDEAEELLNRQLTDCRAGGFVDREPIVQDRIGRLHLMNGRFAMAATTHRHALQEGPRYVVDQAKHLLGLSRALAAQDSLVAAHAVLESGLLQLDQTAAGQARLHLKLELAKVERSLGQAPSALEATTELERLARNMNLQGELQQIYRLRADCLQDLDRPEEALTSLRQAASSWESVRGIPGNLMWREIRGGRRQEGLAATLALAILNDLAEGSTGPVVHQASAEARQFKARTLQERILGHHGKVDASLPEQRDQLLLDFYLGNPESVVFVHSGSALTFYRLPAEADLAPRIRLLRRLMSDPALSPSTHPILEAGQHLGQLLFGPVWANLRPGMGLTVVPDGVLHLLPLAPLLPPNVVSRRVPALGLTVSLTPPSTESAGQSLFLLAAAATPDGMSLPGVLTETDRIHQKYRNTDKVLGAQLVIDPRDPGRDWARYAILHFATHAEANDQTPWASSLYLGAPAMPSLRADRIAQLSLPAPLVVLSGCDTGGGHLISGEGPLGLGSAFLAAGSQAVVMSLWPVDDAVTAELMIAFYDQLSHGHPVDVALHRAQLEVRQRPLTSHPFYWAGFTVLGDGDVVVRLDRRWPVRWPFLLAAFLPILVLARRFTQK
jgi:tetratricopeptide (TPR) repeat protein